MKTSIRVILLLLSVLLPSLSQAQHSMNTLALRNTIQHSTPNERGGLSAPSTMGTHHFINLPESVLLPSGIDSMPIAGTWPQQSNSRALHNIQVDPTDPNKIHAVITGMTDNSGNDIGSLTRRAMYTYSTDAGKTWKAPVILGKLRSGYADMKLFQRNGQWLPVIAAHTYLNASGNPTVSALWIEKGNPGDGKFAQCNGTSVTASGSSNQLIIWPAIAVSTDSKKIYMIASVSPATGGAADQLQFGVWDMNATGDSAVFGGWSQEPGSSDANNVGAGLTSGGAYRIQVSQSGHIGIMWQNSETTDQSLYFNESTDGGSTWYPTLTPVVTGPSNTNRTVSDQTGNTYSWTPSGHFDFWYDGDQSHFMYVGFYDDATDGFYFPYSSEMYYMPDAVEGDSIPVAIGELNGTPGTGIIPNFMDLGGNDVNLEELATIQWPTVAQTADPNHFAVFYQTYLAGDTEVFSDDTGTVVFGYSSIFYSATVDGGQTWTDPQPFMTNDQAASQKFDYRFPAVSEFNPTGASGITYHCVFAVDTAAGYVDSLCTPQTSVVPGFDVIANAHASVVSSVDAVSGNNNGPVALQLTANYPDPFAATTTIQFTVPSESNVILTVADMLGRPIATLVNSRLGPGSHSAVFNGANLADGVYRYTLQADGVSVSKSMSLLR